MLNEHFTGVSVSQRDTCEHIALIGERRLGERCAGADVASLMSAPFTSSELARAIADSKPGKAVGADKISCEMLKHLGKVACQKLLGFINYTWETGRLPNQWKQATITPLLKAGKSASDPSSYRPISITSCVGKLAERMVHKRLYWYIECENLLDPDQSGFRSKRSQWIRLSGSCNK